MIKYFSNKNSIFLVTTQESWIKNCIIFLIHWVCNLINYVDIETLKERRLKQSAPKAKVRMSEIHWPCTVQHNFWVRAHYLRGSVVSEQRRRVTRCCILLFASSAVSGHQNCAQQIFQKWLRKMHPRKNKNNFLYAFYIKNQFVSQQIN